MHKIREAAIARLKEVRSPSPLLILEQDKKLQAVLAGWSFIEFQEEHAPRAKGIDGKTASEVVDIVWDGVTFRAEQINEVFGTRMRAKDVVKQAKSLGLGYPDGTIHPLAEAWIAARVQSMIQGRSKRKT